MSAVLLGGAGCGTSTKKTPAGTGQLVLSSAEAPSSKQCGFDEIGAKARSVSGRTSGYPAAGSYRYATTGTIHLAAQNQPAHRLPSVTVVQATPISRAGSLNCFGTQHSFGSGTSTVDLYIRRGGDLYAVGLGFNTPNEVETVLPRPAILAVSGNATAWSGAFGGPTTGTYRGAIVGQRTFTIAGHRIDAVELESSASFHGTVTGSRQDTTWLSTKGSLIVAETETITIDIGVAADRLSYSARLLSLTPGAVS